MKIGVLSDSVYMLNAENPDFSPTCSSSQASILQVSAGRRPEISALGNASSARETMKIYSIGFSQIKVQSDDTALQTTVNITPKAHVQSFQPAFH